MPQNPDLINPDWIRQGSPAGVYRTNMQPFDCVSDTAALTTQVMTGVGIALQAGDVVTNLTFLSGATAAGTPTNYWFALYSVAATPALLGQSADQLTAAWAADTPKTLALASPVLITVPGWYVAVCMVKATTPPSLVGATMGRAAAAGAIAGSKVLSSTSGSALTTTAPATFATPTTIAAVPLVVVS